MKILCLGNEFIKEDCFAKSIAEILAEEMSELEFININSSFQLLDHLHLQDDIIILDVVKNLRTVRCIRVEDLHQDSINTTHDLDSSFFLQLLHEDARIIGIPQEGDLNEIKEEVRRLLIV